jgi:hypothetical protein
MAFAYCAPRAESGQWEWLIGEGLDTFEKTAAIISGQPKQAERTAKYEAVAAQAELDKARLDQQTALVLAGRGGLGGGMGWLGQPSFLGVPNWLLVAGAGAAAWFLLRK